MWLTFVIIDRKLFSIKWIYDHQVTSQQNTTVLYDRHFGRHLKFVLDYEVEKDNGTLKATFLLSFLLPTYIALGD